LLARPSKNATRGSPTQITSVVNSTSSLEPDREIKQNEVRIGAD
jgi:hypothetical protein